MEPLRARGGFALTVDVEEWYHTCWVEEWVEPARRPHLAGELDRLIPETLALLAETGTRATFFVLGEVARRHRSRLREIVAAGHEVGSHGELHLRVDRWSPPAFARLASETRALLEDCVGGPVQGFRAPEWSMRHPGNPRLRSLAEVGFRYDSSLAASWGSGRRDNRLGPHTLCWPDGLRLVEFPPLLWGGAMRLPACGWTGRLAPGSRVAMAARRQAERGEVAVMTFHPWELVDRPVPGELTGLARLFHDGGRRGYRSRLAGLLRAFPWRPLAEAGEWDKPASEPVAAVSGAAAPAGTAK